MVLIYYKDKETGKVLSFVEAAFSTVEMAKEFLNTNNIITEMDGVVTCIDEVDNDSPIALFYHCYMNLKYEKEEALTDLQKTINKKIDEYLLGKPKRSVEDIMNKADRYDNNGCKQYEFKEPKKS